MISRTARRGCCAGTVSMGRLPITYPHRTIVGEIGKSEVLRVMLDYWLFKENASRRADEQKEKVEATVSLTALVLKETMCDSVWAYALKSKSVAELNRNNYSHSTYIEKKKNNFLRRCEYI